MVSPGENEAATATCSKFPLRLLDRKGKAKKYTVLTLVCEHGDFLLGCAIAQGPAIVQGEEQHEYYGLHWHKDACE